MAGWSGNGPRPPPSLAVVVVVEVVRLGDSMEQEGRLEGRLVSGESDIELGPGGPGLESSLVGPPDLMGPLGPMFMSGGPGLPGPNCPLGPIIPAGPRGLLDIIGGPRGPIPGP